MNYAQFAQTTLLETKTPGFFGQIRNYISGEKPQIKDVPMLLPGGSPADTLKPQKTLVKNAATRPLITETQINRQVQGLPKVVQTKPSSGKTIPPTAGGAVNKSTRNTGTLSKGFNMLRRTAVRHPGAAALATGGLVGGGYLAGKMMRGEDDQQYYRRR